VVDAGLVGILFVAPLFMGGRGPVGRLAFVLLTAVVAVAWCGRQACSRRGSWRWTGVEWLLLAGLAVLLLQLAPLSAGVLTRLSPTLAELLPAWQAGGALDLGEWARLSLYPAATLSGLVTYVSYVLLFLVVAQRVRHVEDVERLLRWVALASIAMACLGLAQMLLGNGKFLWIYEHPSRSAQGAVKGTFQNQNHFAHCLVLGVAPLIWWLHALGRPSRRSRPSSTTDRPDVVSRPVPSLQTLALWGGLAVVALAVLLTYSRGGVLVFAIALGTCVGIGFRQAWFGRRSLVVLAALVCLLGGALSIFGYEPLLARLRTMSEARDLQQLSAGRRALWEAHAEAIPRFWLTGTGVGTHAYVYKTYLKEHVDVEFTHGESGYLHLLLETGALGCGLFLIGVLIVSRWSLGTLSLTDDRRLAACSGAIVPGLLASLIHAVAEFAWYIPACMSVTVIFVACANRLHNLAITADQEKAAQGGGGWSFELSRPAWLTAMIIVCLAGAALVRERAPAALAAAHGDACRKLTRLPREQRREPAVMEAIALHLAQALEHNPHDARAHSELADLSVRRFDVSQLHAENPIPLSQIREAALASQFPSRAAQDEWLHRAIGQNQRMLEESLAHARRAVQLCPLQGESYVTLAKLAFLEGPQSQRKLEYVKQALRVRPQSGPVLLAAGLEVLETEPAQAIEYWKPAFHHDPDARWELIELLASRVPLEGLLTGLQPDLAGLNDLFDYYRRAGQEAAAQQLAQQLAPRMEQQAREAPEPQAAATYWDQARLLYSSLQATSDSLRCAHQAVAADPSSHAFRSALADCLIAAEQVPEAIEQLEWCLRRNPDDESLRLRLAEVRRRQLSSGSRTATDASAASYR